jgi:hypothetical protein
MPTANITSSVTTTAVPTLLSSPLRVPRRVGRVSSLSRWWTTVDVGSLVRLSLGFVVENSQGGETPTPRMAAMARGGRCSPGGLCWSEHVFSWQQSWVWLGCVLAFACAGLACFAGGLLCVAFVACGRQIVEFVGAAQVDWNHVVDLCGRDGAARSTNGAEVVVAVECACTLPFQRRLPVRPLDAVRGDSAQAMLTFRLGAGRTLAAITVTRARPVGGCAI